MPIFKITGLWTAAFTLFIVGIWEYLKEASSPSVLCTPNSLQWKFLARFTAEAPCFRVTWWAAIQEMQPPQTPATAPSQGGDR